MNVRMMIFLPALVLLLSHRASAAEPLCLENDKLALRFDSASGRLTAIENKLTGESYGVSGDEFAIEAVEFGIEFAKLKPAAVKRAGDTLTARYEGGGMTVAVAWTLRHNHHFAEKRMTLTAPRDYGLKKVTVSRPTFAADGLNFVSYRYPQFGRLPGTEPLSTYFGRTAKGGFFTGVEMPFDASSLSDRQVTLAYAPSLKVKAGERLVCEPVYVGVYRRRPADDQPPAHPPIRSAHGKPQPVTVEVLPLPSESDAMVAMTSAILGPPRHGLVAMACGWHSEMQHGTYADEQAVEQEMRSLDFLAECGVDWLSDSHPWGGETAKMNALGANDKYAPGELVTEFLKHARKKGVKVVMWPSMNNTHHWSGAGRPFRADQPEWLMTPKTLDGKPDLIKRAKANCFANTPFFNWLSRINNNGLTSGYYKAWCMDGSFFGDGGWFTTVIPVDCASDQHDHLPGDSNYACQRALDRLIAGVRQQSPDVFVLLCRPPMDLGVWSLRNADACFTLLESGSPPANVTAGDEIRKWSRVRVHHHFFPHYFDQPLLFQSRYLNDKRPFNWSGAKLNYILLSALSSSPNQLYYLPTKTGIPDQDKAELRKWLDWGRKNIAYLKVRKDLPDWPAPGKVDGSAHVVGDRGLVFLFNPNDKTLPGEFALTAESIGLKGEGAFSITQEHPTPGRTQTARSGETVRWEVPAQTAVVLRIQKADKK
ncbi:MAG: hypothetical protein HZA91_11625 [Verrucomicrobia bacterium]|nr:hypothetical protein [Verrucomicrobiota bacterium]